MTTETNEAEKVSEELVGEIDQAVAEVTVISEGHEETVKVPEENSEETQETFEETVKKDTQQETQEDTQVLSNGKSEDTLEESEENTSTDNNEETNEEVEEKLPVSLSQESVVRGMGNGLSFSEARSFSSEAELNDFSNRVEYAAQAQAVRKQKQEQEVVDPFADLPKLDPENYDPEIIGMFDRLTGIVKGQYETIQGFQNNQQQFQEHYHAATQAANQAEIEGWFDDAVEGLGEDFKDVLGSGKYQTLEKGSSEFQNRDAIANHMGILIAGYNSQGLPVPSRSEIFDVAARQVLADKYSEIKNNKLSNELEGQSKQLIQRANKSTSTVVKTPEEEDADLAELIDSTFSG
jgi:hypothetical protein